VLEEGLLHGIPIVFAKQLFNDFSADTMSDGKYNNNKIT
jgi:hypothetical protein